MSTPEPEDEARALAEAVIQTPTDYDMCRLLVHLHKSKSSSRARLQEAFAAWMTRDDSDARCLHQARNQLLQMTWSRTAWHNARIAATELDDDTKAIMQALMVSSHCLTRGDLVAYLVGHVFKNDYKYVGKGRWLRLNHNSGTWQKDQGATQLCEDAKNKFYDLMMEFIYQYFQANADCTKAQFIQDMSGLDNLLPTHARLRGAIREARVWLDDGTEAPRR